MKNKILGLFAILGLILIIIGVFFLMKKENNIPIENSIIIDTSNINGIKINNEKYPYYDIKEFEHSYVKDLNLNRKNKYIFPIPKNLENTYHSEFYRIFKNEDIIVTAEINNNIEIDKYIEQLKTEYSTYSYGIFNYSDINEIKISNYNAKYFKIQAYSDLENIEGKFLNNNYIENFVLIINMEESSVLLSYTSLSQKMSDKFLSELVDKIKINEKEAIYLSSKKENNKLVGVLEIKDIYQNSKLYKLNFKINADKFYEVEDLRNDYDKIILYSHDNEIFTTMQLVQYNLNDTDLVIEEYLKRYYNNHELQNYKKKEKVNNKHTYSVISFNPLDEKLEDMFYYKQFFEKISENIYIIISCSSLSEINDEEIIKYFDYSLE